MPIACWPSPITHRTTSRLATVCGSTSPASKPTIRSSPRRCNRSSTRSEKSASSRAYSPPGAEKLPGVIPPLELMLAGLYVSPGAPWPGDGLK